MVYKLSDEDDFKSNIFICNDINNLKLPYIFTEISHICLVTGLFLSLNNCDIDDKQHSTDLDQKCEICFIHKKLKLWKQ